MDHDEKKKIEVADTVEYKRAMLVLRTGMHSTSCHSSL